jgi:hypothetical protein
MEGLVPAHYGQNIPLLAHTELIEDVMSELVATLRTAATQWRTANQDRRGGVVLIWQGDVYGWKDGVRNADHERPGAYAVDEAGHVFIAEGGDDQNGAKGWVAVNQDN